MLDGGEAMRPPLRVAVGAHNVRQLEPRDRDRRAPRGHGAHDSDRRKDRRRAVEQVQARRLGRERGVCQMPVPRGRLDRPMPQ